MSKVSVYLGSSPFCKKDLLDAAYHIGYELASHGHTVIYGGTTVGTMGRLADGVKAAGGKVIGVFPKGFKGTRDIQVRGIDVERRDLDELIEVANFAEHKQLMEDLCDCGIVLPGSFGTLDELFTSASNYSIEKTDKRIYVLNFHGYYDPLIKMIDNMRTAGFFKERMEGAIRFFDSVDALVSAIDNM